MAKARPSLGGIFRLKGKRDSQILLTGVSYNSKENLSPSGGDGMLKSPTHFGNYKPKIFNEADKNEDSTSAANKFSYSGQREATAGRIDPEPAIPSTSGLNQGNYTPRYASKKETLEKKASASNKDYISAKTSSANGKKPSVKKGYNVKSSKNFIMMGDKDTPMVLETPAGDTSLDGNELPDELPGEDSENTNYRVENTTDALEQILTFTEEPEVNNQPSPVKDSSGSTNHTLKDVDYESSSGVDSEMQSPNSDMPYIPPPDYDEVSMTLDMADEDPNYQGKPTDYRTVYRTYQGDDFSQYLYEADSVYQTPSDRIRRRQRTTPKNRQASRPKSSKKTGQSNDKSLTGTLSRALFGSSAKNAGEETIKRRTIHEFSYSHSKLSNQPLGNTRNTLVTGRTYTMENNHRHSSGKREGGYELFLKARHSKGGSLESTSDSGNETAEDNESPTHRDFTNTSYSTPNKYVKRNGIWEKLTLRFRRRSRGELGTVN